jgi:hypothetical protein
MEGFSAEFVTLIGALVGPKGFLRLFPKSIDLTKRCFRWPSRRSEFAWNGLAKLNPVPRPNLATGVIESHPIIYSEQSKRLKK